MIYYILKMIEVLILATGGCSVLCSKEKEISKSTYFWTWFLLMFNEIQILLTKAIILG